MTEAANKILSQVHEACAPYLEKIPYADKLHEVDSKTAAQIAVGALVLIPTTYYTYQVIQFFRRLRKIGREVDKLPGDPKHWLWGNLHQHPGANEEGLIFILNQAKKFPGVERFWFTFMRPVVALSVPSLIKSLATTHAPKPINGTYGLVLPWLGYGLLLSKGQQWHRNRKLLTPAFHFDVLKPYMQVYNEAADTLIAKWMPYATRGESVEIYQPVSLCTLNIIMRCAFSYNADVQGQGDSHPYANAVINMATLIVKRIFKLYCYLDFIYYMTPDGRQFRDMCKYAHQVAYDLIAKRKKALEENPDERKKRYLDFLDILLLARDESGKGLSELEMRQEVDTFLFEGHDTTASAISWCLYTLAKHPDIQEQAYEEVKSLMAGRDSDHMVWDDLSELPFLTKCIKESLRLTPPVPFIGRELDKPMEIEGVTLLPGTFVDINIWAVHHNEHVWGKDHMEYKPERFNPENMKNMDSFAFIPFSAGPRNCIGQNFAMHELKVVISRVLLKYELKVDTDHKVEMKPELVMRAKDGIKLYLQPRA